MREPGEQYTSAALYYPTRTILTTPDQFMALVPASDALDIASQIAEAYANEMSKVRSRLPLDLALISFHRKMPLYAVMDAARRFLNQAESAEEQWQVRGDHQAGTMPIRFTNGYCWEIPTTFGDGNDDNFYPYVGLWDTAAKGEYQAHGRGYIHIKHLQPGCEIAVAPSRFSYLWLDNSARRYSIDTPEEAVPFSTQQRPLEEIEWHINTWKNLQEAQQPQITDTRLHGVVQLLLEMRIAWGNRTTFASETFADFAINVLWRSGLAEIGITQEDVTSGRLFRCFDLHHRIMKRSLHDDRQSRQSQGKKEPIQA